MFAFVARQPILDIKKDVFAYELMFRDGKNGAYPNLDPEKMKFVANRFHTLGLDDICGDKKSFINFSTDTLKTSFPSTLDPETVVVELNEDPGSDNGIADACEHLKKLGYKIAVDDPLLLSGQHPIFPLIDIVKVDISQDQLSRIEKSIPQFTSAGIQLVAEQVNSYQDFDACSSLGFDYFQGYFFAQPEARIRRDLPASKFTLVELMSASAEPHLDVDRINKIIERDAGLSFLLLKFINNPTVNKRYKITSLRHALNFMGEVEIKKFIALLSIANLGTQKPLELIHMSLVRAKFFDLLTQKYGSAPDSSISFLVGLFSLLDAILDQNVEDVLSQIPLAKEVNEALLGKSASFNHYFTLVRAFESALWLNVVKQAKLLGVDQKELHSLYNQAIVWGNAVRNNISEHFPRAAAG